MNKTKISSQESGDTTTSSSSGGIKHFPVPRTHLIKTRIKSVKKSEISKIKEVTQKEVTDKGN